MDICKDILKMTIIRILLSHIYVLGYICIFWMKKRSSSSRGSDKSQQKPKRQKKTFTFQYNKLDCFLSNPSEKQSRPITTPVSKPTPKLSTLPSQLRRDRLDRKANFDMIKVPRRNRGKIPSNSRQAFNNSVLLLEYENEEEPQKQQAGKSRERRESPKSEQQNEMVSAILNSCMRVITQDTQHSSNPLSARYSPRDPNNQEQLYMGSAYSESSLPLVLQMMPDGYYYYVKNPAVRNRRAISTQQSKAYVVDLNRIVSDGRTTIMVRNIPNKYSQDMLLELFEKNHKKKFDFFYLPIDYNNNCNVGYAFINFIHTKFIEEFYQEFHNHKWDKFNSTKVCQVCYARIQGTAQLEHHFEHSNVINQKDKRYRPLIGLKSLTDNIHSLVRQQREGGQGEDEGETVRND